MVWATSSDGLSAEMRTIVQSERHALRKPSDFEITKAPSRGQWTNPDGPPTDAGTMSPAGRRTASWSSGDRAGAVLGRSLQEDTRGLRLYERKGWTTLPQDVWFGGPRPPMGSA
jgi:hypothetical protein